MYEIWLTLNIVWELMLDAWPLVLAAALAWVVLTGLALAKGGGWGAALKPALLAAVVVGVVSVFAVPALTKSSLAELAYWVDWANVIGIGAAVGAVAAAFVWPLGALMRARRHG
jgi:hypothetical protein